MLPLQQKRWAPVQKLFTGKHGAILGALLTFLPLLAMTIAMWWSEAAETKQIARERFAFKVSEAQFAIQQRLLAYEQVLRGGIALFAANDEVTRGQWRTYVRELNLDKNFPGIQAIAHSQRILPADLKGHLQKIRSEGFPEYAIRPTGERAEYVSVVYIEPFNWRNQRAFGFDLMAEPVRREALLRARDTGLPSVTGRIKLMQETTEGVQNGFLMCSPVFPKGDAPQALAARRAALTGYLCSVFRMNDLMRGILGPEKLPNIHLQIFDGTTIAASNLMYDSEDGAAAAQRLAPAFTTDQAFEFDGRQWTLRFNSLPAFDATIDAQKPRLILFSGALVSLLVAAVVWSLALNRRRARELAGANRGLETEIAERNKLEGELKQAKDVAEEANRAKSDFLANVSHELRTPLTLILAPLEQLLAAPKALANWRPQLERVQRNALLLLNRVNDILDFSKAEAGKLEVRWEAVDLVELISILAADAAVIAESKGCSLTWGIDPVLDRVCLDRRYFEKIVLNLVSNALKFTPSGGWIRVEATALDNAWFELAVADSGCGIPADKLPLLFKRFQQIDTSATRQHGGTGIGLALVKEFAELMGGSVGVDSTPSQGARFFMRLPRGAERIANLLDTAKADVEQVPTAADARLRRIGFQEGTQTVAAAHIEGTAPARSAPLPQALVADDNPDMRAYIAEVLRDECAVLTAADGRQAWALLQRQAIEVVVSDVMMPELDGIGLTARIRANSNLSHIPVILVTARGGAEASVSGLDTGADDYIAKPFSPLELKARVRAALRMSQVQAQLRDKSREAGMSMIATGILHNLGNVLNGITVSSNVIQDQLRASKVVKLRKAAELLQKGADDRSTANDHRGQRLAQFLAQLSEHLEAEQAALLGEVESLRDCVEHAAGVIATQQNFAKPHTQLQELASASSLMEAALKLSLAAFEMHGIEVERDYADTPSVTVDRHKVLQILLNLLSNARHAVRDLALRNKRVWLRTVWAGDRVRLEVSDNGVGIDPRHLPKLFHQGFSTKEGGHGFGLHSSAIWARELGGQLTCYSDGPGRGSTFTLELPAPQSDAPAMIVRPDAEAVAY